MSTAKILNHAKRGDPCAIATKRVDYVIGRGNELTVSVTLHKVVSVSRTGLVLKTTEYGWGDTPHKVDTLRQTVYVIPPHSVDADALVAAYLEHTYPGHASQVMPFPSVDAFRAFCAPFRKVAA